MEVESWANPAPPRVAIVGLAGRFPGAPDIETFWGNLVNGVESLTYLEDEGLRAVGVPEHRFTDPHYIRLKPLMDDVDGFDARLFGFSGREAQVTDPQQRVFLEICHTALEHAGCAPDRYAGRIGVFGGGAPNTYMENVVYESEAARQAVGDVGIEISNASDYVATRVAYALGLTGPAISVETACSTALVAVHLACRAIRDGECEMALAGAVNIRVPDYRGEMWAENNIFARDGHVRAFDASASGTNFGFGAGVVVLKDYDAAVADGDTVHAVVAGSAINNDGAARSSFSAPSIEGQREVILAALREAGGLDPDTIGYVEAHGTGTKVGDPVEVTALTEAYRAAGSTGVQQIPIGSVKTNIGHLGAAAGAPALIKAVLAMTHGTLPPSLHCEQPNPAIDFASSPFHVNRHQRPWPAVDGPMRAGVSAFGIGGTNAHLVLEAPPQVERPAEPEPGPQVLPLSAHTSSALEARAAELASFLADRPDTSLADVARTLQVGRTAYGHRAAVVASSAAEAAELLPAVTAVKAAPAADVAFLFSGQGSQYVGMARELHEHEPVFRDAMAECADGLLRHLGLDLRDIVFGEESEELTARLQQTELTQPALFAVEYALAELWGSWGVEPAAMLGHSVGEIVAACRSGVFALDAALAFVAARGRLIQSIPPGSMLAVPLAEDDVRAAMPPELAVAAVNAPRSTVVSGPAEVVGEFESTLARIGVPGRPLVTSHAFHSAMLDPILDGLAAAAEAAEPGAPSTPFISTVTGDWITDDEASDPRYWSRQARLPVRFAAAVETAAASARSFVEVGPGRGLASLAAQVLGGQRGEGGALSSLGASGSQRRDARAAMLDAAGRLWTDGVPVAWEQVAGTAHGRRIPLPTYPYERQRFWVEPDPIERKPSTDRFDRATLDPAARVTSVPAWRQRRLDVTGAVEGQVLLVFTPGDGPAEELARLLPAIRVDLGEEYEQVGDRHFRMSAAGRGDYASLLKALDDADLRPTTIVHGWAATPADGDPLDPAEVAGVRERGFDSVTALCQAVALRWPSHEVGLRIVTTLACNVSGADPVEPAKALLRGVAKTAPIELANLSCQLIDLDGGPTRGALLAEVRAPITDQVVAIRGGRRWVEDFEPAVGLPERIDLPWALRHRGVYLVTGGLGDVGLRTAEELARTTAGRIVLLGRTPFPGREEWDEIAAAAPSRTTEVIARMRAFEELGADVMTVAADVADEASMRSAIDLVHDRFGPVNGVFHAAGIPGGGLIAMKTLEQAHGVLRPKVDGLLTIDRLLGDEVELLVLFSSIFAISGGFGQSDYAAANSFLDAYAQSCSDRAARVESINYCGWIGHGMVNADARVASTRLEDVEPATDGLLGERVPERDEPVFRTSIGPAWHWVLTEHQMAGQAVFPGTSYVDMIATACRRVTGADIVELRDVLFGQPLVIDGNLELKVEGTTDGGGAMVFTVSSRPLLEDGEGAWQRHASATAAAVADAAPPGRLDVASVAARCDGPRWSPDLTNPDDVVVFGPHWDVVESISRGDGEQIAWLRLPDTLAEDLPLYTVHPSLLDCATALSMYRPEVAGDDESFLPIAYDRIVVWGQLSTEVVSHLTRRGGAKGISSYNVSLADRDGTVRVSIEGFSVKAVNVDEVHRGLTGSGAASTPALGIVEDEQLIGADEAIDLLWRILDEDGECQHVVSVEPLDDRARRMAGLAQRVTSALEAADASQFVESRAERAAGAAEPAGGEPQTGTESQLLTLWQDAFALSDLGVEEDFFELGGNSLVAVQLAVRAREVFGVEVPGIAVMEYPTVRTMAGFIDSLVPSAAGVS